MSTVSLMPRQTIEGYDPGESTGYVLGWLSETEPFTLSSAMTLDYWDTQDMIIRWPIWPHRIRVVESFKLRGSNKFTANLDGKELIGAMKLQQRNCPLVPIVWQTPQDKGLVDDQVLKDSGLWFTPTRAQWKTGRHINDAIIHVLGYLKRSGHQPTIDKYWGDTL